MIVEMRIDLVKPRRVPVLEERVRASLTERTRLSPLAAFWRTEVGTVDQVVHLWPYRSHAHRDEIQAAAGEGPAEPSDLDDLLMHRESRLIQPAPFSPPLEPAGLGGLYELRIYSYEPGAIPTVIQRWAEKIDARRELSPLVLCGYSLSGRLHQWIHIWAYKDAVERQRIRAEANRRGIWPPDARAGLIKQENMLLLPLRFSPLN